MLVRRGLDEAKRKALSETVDPKTQWSMICQDKRAELSVSGRRVTPLDETDENAPPLINVLSDLAGEMWSATRDSTARAQHDRYTSLGRQFGRYWVIRFTDLKGLRTISTGLSFLNKKPDSER
ncbi:hypothetical protein HPULCUR_006520 [Helicostylum pulchrum]|uniref:Uncharacterized protein n=1 Tax=Helicostylum pulchrum TaxID=562976 RepID=A0ABP9Y2R1_9FUNG